MTSNERTLRARRVAVLTLASALGLPAAVAIGCGGVAAQPPTVGGESHFLQYCDDNCAVGLDCIAGVCTKGCLVADMASCSAFSGAACTDASVEPGAVAVCDVDCVRDADCSGVGRAHRCEGGFCRAPGGGVMGTGGTGATGTGGTAPTAMGGTSSLGPPVGGSMGGTAPTATGGTSGMGPPVGMLDCNIYRTINDPPQLELVVRNDRMEPVYVPQVVETNCGSYPLRIWRNGAPVDISSGGCATSCERVQDEGATSPGSTGTACPALCPPLPLVVIGPGEERRYRVDALELGFREMPNDCFSGDFESVACFTRSTLPAAEYTINLPGFTEFVCASELVPCGCQEPDANGICPPNITQGGGQSLIATASFTRPSPENMIDTSLTTVTLSFNFAMAGPP